MKLESRINEAETRVWGAGINPARIISVLKHGTWRELSDAEITWVIAEWEKENGITPETSAEVDRLLESLSDADLQAIRASGELSIEGQTIMAGCTELLGGAK